VLGLIRVALSRPLQRRVRDLVAATVGIAGEPSPGVETVHGDFGLDNILVHAVGSSRLRLAAVVDFEAARRGDGMWDVATLSLRLLLAGHRKEMVQWRDVAARTWPPRRISKHAVVFLLAQHLRRCLAARTDPEVAVVSNDELLTEAETMLCLGQ
jgi:hypothetical protein